MCKNHSDVKFEVENCKGRKIMRKNVCINTLFSILSNTCIFNELNKCKFYNLNWDYHKVVWFSLKIECFFFVVEGIENRTLLTLLCISCCKNRLKMSASQKIKNLKMSGWDPILLPSVHSITC